jgi:hypothetical protein
VKISGNRRKGDVGTGLGETSFEHDPEKACPAL